MWRDVNLFNYLQFSLYSGGMKNEDQATNSASLPPHEQDARLFRLSMRRLREEMGWTQNQLATELRQAGASEFSQVAVARLERGERAVKLGEARIIAKILGTSIDKMLEPQNLSAKYINHFAQAVDNMQSITSKAIPFTSFYEVQRISAVTNLEYIYLLKQQGELTDDELDALKGIIIPTLLDSGAAPLHASSVEILDTALYHQLYSHGLVKFPDEVKPFLDELEERTVNVLENLGLSVEKIDEEISNISLERLQEISERVKKFGVGSNG